MEVLTRKYYADIVDSWIGKGNHRAARHSQHPVLEQSYRLLCRHYR